MPTLCRISTTCTRSVGDAGRRAHRAGYHWNDKLPITNPDIVLDTKLNGYHGVPQLAEIVPKMATQGDASVKLALSGLGFVSRSQILFNGVALPTRFEGAARLSADIPAALLATPGTWPVES